MDEYRTYWALINASWICLGFEFELLDIGYLSKYLSDTN